MKRKKICGIYIIKNKINNKVYIGQSIDIHKRWLNHKNKLRKYKHDNIHLQRSWNKYGEENFEFSILELCNKKLLSKKEREYIKKYKANIDNYGYNLTDGGEKTIINKEILLQKSKKYSKKVIQFDKNSNYIKEYQNAIYAAKEYDGNDSAIYQCCLGRLKSAYGYMWKFKKDCAKNILKFDNNQNDTKEYKREFKSIPVCQINLNGNLIKEWRNCGEIGKFYNIASENIRSCCNKEYGRKTYIGYIWMYSKEYFEKGIDLKYYKHVYNGKKVEVYDLNGKYLKTYESARAIERETGIGYKLVSKCCKGEAKQSHGYIFKFA